MEKLAPAEIAGRVSPLGKNCRTRQFLPGVLGN
jgi:hypothetical protein